MKHLTSISLLWLLCLAAANFADARSGGNATADSSAALDDNRAEGRREFSPADGSFIILFPGQPKRESGELFAEGWLLKTLKHSANPGARYSVTYFNAPPLTDRPDFALGLLKGLRSATLAEAKGQVLTEKEIVLEGHPGFFLEVADKKGAITRTLLYAVGQRLYLLSVRSGTEPADKSAADNFFGSFKLIPVKESALDLTIGPGSASMDGAERTPVATGVIQGKVRDMPEPGYPSIAKSARASGAVPVQVVVDEHGEVIAARPLAGHPLLRESAARAALRTRFTPTLLEGRPIKIAGVIRFSFSLR